LDEDSEIIDDEELKKTAKEMLKEAEIHKMNNPETEE